MDHLLESLLSVGNIITVLVTAAVTWAGSFLFYRQKRDSLNIENEARQSEEWRKLYLDSQEDSRNKDNKIDELRKMINAQNIRLIDLERRVQINSIYRCEVLNCPNRLPPMASTPETDA